MTGHRARRGDPFRDDGGGRQGRPATLLLVRHAHVGAEATARLCGWFDPPLTDRGRREAARLAVWLRNRALAGIYASPLGRARETAAIVGRATGHPLWLLGAVKEIGCGALDGEPIERIQRDHADLWARNLAQDDEQFRWPGGESYAEFRERVRTALDAIADAHPGDQVLVVTHTGVITQAIGMIEGRSAARWDVSRPRYASVTVAEWSRGHRCLRAFDRCEHVACADAGGGSRTPRVGGGADLRRAV